jgi:hypothetical protein
VDKKSDSVIVSVQTGPDTQIPPMGANRKCPWRPRTAPEPSTPDPSPKVIPSPTPKPLQLETNPQLQSERAHPIHYKNDFSQILGAPVTEKLINHGPEKQRKNVLNSIVKLFSHANKFCFGFSLQFSKLLIQLQVKLFSEKRKAYSAMEFRTFLRCFSGPWLVDFSFHWCSWGFGKVIFVMG